jgi:hypothetical protein
LKALANILVVVGLAACGGPSAPPPISTALIPAASSAAPPPVAPGDCAEQPYVASPEYSGRPANLPPVPELADGPRKDGDAFTVFGATHALTSRFESREVTAKEITIVGWIVDSNLATAPRCALHKTGQKDPDGCFPEIPSFSIQDTRGAVAAPRIKVLGWAKNFATVFDANALYAKGKPATLYRDEVWAVDVPYPLPAVGAKVRVTGNYGFMFTKASTGVVADPRNGVMTYRTVEVLEPAPKPAKLGK